MVNSGGLISVEGDVMSVAQEGTKESEFSDIGVIGREALTRDSAFVSGWKVRRC